MTRQIAIDGPAGAGKSTIAKAVAKELGFVYIDTGAMYRALALEVLKTGCDPSDEAAVVEICSGTDISLAHADGAQRIFLNGADVTGEIRTEEIGDTASAISTYEAVRAHMVRLQQQIAGTIDVVMDGRDIGTVVLPDAPCKVFLTAAPEVRADRRVKELKEKGQTADYEQVLNDIRERDHRDTTREHSPLKQADDAVLLDSSSLTIDEVCARVIGLYKERM